MNLSSFKEKEIAIVVIVSIFIISIVTFYYSTFDVQRDVRESLFEQQKDRQLTQVEAIANNIQSDSELALSYLRGLANSLYLQNGVLSGNETENLLKETYAEVGSIGDRLFVIDNKNIVRLNIVPEGENPFIGTDMSSIQWVIEARSNLAPTFSKGVVGLDGKHRIFITYPIINRQDGNYMGLVGLAIPTIQFFEKYASVNNIESQFMVAYDREGNYIATPRSELLGKNFLSEEVQKFFNYNTDQNKLYQEVFSESKPSYAVYNFGGGERLNTGYPIIIRGQPVYFIFVITPTETIYSQIENILGRQQTELFIQRLVFVGGIAAVTFFIIRLNSKLKQRVKERTSSLEESNQKLVKANKLLETHDKIQREFINIAAHELRTPIVPILTLSEILYSRVKELQQEGHKQGGGGEEEEMLEIILRNANRLHQLTEDILDVTRIESHTLTLRKERLNLNDVILNVVEDYRRQIANSSSSTSSNTNNGNVKLVYEPANSGKTTLLVEADKRRLTQVISNLLNNAIKFTQEGTVTVSTSMIKRKEGTGMEKREREGSEAVEEGEGEEAVLIAVKDTGTGIDPELMPRLFTKFATKSYQGTGLGLFISKSIVEAHGGKMWAENNNSNYDDNNNGSNNRKHNGATFYFTLPVVSMTELRMGEEKEVRVIND
ncbi:MAG: sensor histidine kinase [Thermoproteota archaeon]|nr:sensor histidine kinase [Thermoproteota archaeon]